MKRLLLVLVIKTKGIRFDSKRYRKTIQKIRDCIKTKRPDDKSLLLPQEYILKIILLFRRK